MRRWLACVLLLIAWPVYVWSNPPATPPTEYQVKAAFIYNFMKFVEWPDSTFESGHTPMTVSVLGSEDFVHTLRSAVAQRSINDRTVEVVHSETLSDIKPGHLLYVAAALADSMEQIHGYIHDTATLVVGDDHRMVGHGAMIGFFLQNNKVRFTIDADLASESGLRISSRLLKLAQPSPVSEQ